MYYQDNFLRELIVDNFAGGGGASVGIELALGRPVDIAVNHDENAIAMHKVNHPFTKHYQEDVFAIDPEQVTDGRPVGIGWFSPDCKHFSRAKGGKPVEKKIRGLSWVILKWAMSEKSSPRVIFMENVPEIQTWGPLKEVNGKTMPDPARSGETFKGFIAMLSKGISSTHPAFAEACEFLKIAEDSIEASKLLRGLGYKVEFKELKACDYGCRTQRGNIGIVRAMMRRLSITRKEVKAAPSMGDKAHKGERLRTVKYLRVCLNCDKPNCHKGYCELTGGPK